MPDPRQLYDRTRATYQRHARAWDDHRAGHLMERPWLQRFAERLPTPGPILDLGCGTGQPIAAYFIERGYEVVGIDFAPAMIDIAQARWPEQTWLVGDMRTLALDRTFAGIVAWNSFFHLTENEQPTALIRFARHLVPGGVLMTTIGDRAGEITGTVEGDAVYHASLSPAGYRTAAHQAGLTVEALTLRDESCGAHSILLAVTGRDLASGPSKA